MQIKRDKYLNDLIIRMNNGMVKVVTGPRRCGKTYLLFDLFVDYLHSQGIDDTHIIQVALDDDDNKSLRDPGELSKHLKKLISGTQQQYYILLDEVQYAISDEELKGSEPPRLYGVLNGLLRRRNVDVYVTGSNSKMLSTDVLTEFRGRGDEVRIRPLSFAEFMQVFRGDIYQGWAEYVTYGGMPLAVGMPTDEQKARYLKSLFEETYLKDIINRNKLKRTRELEDLVNGLASCIGSLSSATKLQDAFKSQLRSSISYNTINTYISHLKDAFVIDEAERYDVKGRKIIGATRKYYFEDMGLRNARLGFRQIEQTHIMENIIYNELCMRGYSVDVGVVEARGRDKNGKSIRRQLEVDFVANKGSNRCYIQSAYQMPDSAKEQQEKTSLKELNDSFSKIVLVRDVMKPTRDNDGILTMSVYDFLLDPQSLERL